VLQFLGPLDAAGDNEASLVFRWDAGDARFLLTGDAGIPAETQLLQWGPELRADVLKVGHHGSAGSSSDGFLAAVDAPVSVISCGRNNRFGHPAPAALERLAARRTRVVRTDQSGMVTVRVGRAVEVETALTPR
jgi:competence protein ComEC